MKQRKLHITGLYAFRRLRRLQGSIRLGRLRLPRLIPPTFLQGCKPTVCLFALQKRRIQPKRYVQLGLKFVENILTKIKETS
jgi:hypothetical protein